MPLTRVELDQRLGWRWLLPKVEGGALRIVGFSAAEADVLMSSWHTGPAPVLPIGGEVVVINADTCSWSRGACERQLRTAAAAVILGRTSRLARFRRSLIGFSDVRDYGLLPLSRPRVVVPLACGRWTRAALALHRPGRPVARAAVALADRLTWISMAGPLFGYRLRIATRDLRSDGSTRCDHALYLGTADENRKTVVLPLGPADPNRIRKVAASAVARESLSREANALQLLGQSAVADQVPRLLDFRRTGREAELEIEYRPRRVAPEARIRQAAAAFLARLGAMDVAEVSLYDWLIREGLTLVLNEVGAMRGAFDRMIASGAVLRLQRGHGDFAPWNSAWTDKGLFVFDWEASRPHQLAFSDAFHYVVAPALLVDQRASPADVVAQALDFASIVAGKMGLPSVDLPTHLAVWLLATKVKRPAPLLDALLAEAAARIKWRG